MSSSMLAGERRWASARRGGMTILGKVAVPKPLNLPSQKLENHGLDPNVEIVPKGSLSWGSRPSSSTPNPWGSSAISPKADGATGSPSHPCGHPPSGGGLSRPSTAGSDRTHEPAASAWVPNSRPSSASGVLPSNQSSLTSRPHSAETRPGSSHLSRFAEPVSDNSVAWGPNGTVEKLLMPSQNTDFSLSSGDFPTLGSEKDNAGKNSNSHDHGSHVRPSSASGRTAPAKESNAISDADVKSGTVNTWTRDGHLHVEDGAPPSAEKWQGEQQYANPNVPLQHFDAWRGPPMNAPAGVWYSGPPGGPPYPPVGHGGFPLEPFPYYRPQMPPALANSQPCPPPGVGPRGHHPKNGDFYRPQMPDAFIRPGMPIRPGFYPGPVPYDGYYGPPMGYNPNEHNIPFMGMPHGPPVYNMYPAQNPSEPSDAHFRAGGCGSTGTMLVPEQLDSGRSEESRGPHKVRRKRENEWDAGTEAEDWVPTMVGNSLSLGKGDQPRPSSRKNEQGAENRRDEDVPSRRNTSIENSSSRNFGKRGNSSDSVIVNSREGMHKSKILGDSLGKKSENGATSSLDVPHVLPAEPKDSCLIPKIDGLDAKARVSDVRKDAASGFLREEQKNRLLVNPKVNNSTVEVGSTYTGDLAPPFHDMFVRTGDNTIKSTIASAPQLSRRPHHGVQNRADHLSKGRLNGQDADGWRKNPPVLGPESAAAVSNQNSCHTTTSQVPDHRISMEAVEKSESKNAGDSSTPMFDSTDGQAQQRAKMRELAKQRAIQLQKEEEERIREQKAKALAKLEELNRRTLAADATTQNVEKTATSDPVQQDVHGSQALPESVIAASKHEALSSDLSAKSQAIAQIRESSTSGAGQSTALLRDSHLETPKSAQPELVVSHGQLLPLKQNVVNATDDEGKATQLANDGSLPKQKRVGHKQKQSIQVEKNLADKSTLIGTSEMLKGPAGAVIQNSGTNVAVSGEALPSIESSLQNNFNILLESTTHQRKRNNKGSKNKHLLDDTSRTATASLSSASRESNLAQVSTESGKPKSPELKLDPSTVLVIDSKDAVQPNLEQNSLQSEEAHGRANNQYKHQHSHRVPRNPQANVSADRFHGGDAVMWAPVRPQNKPEPGEEVSQKTEQDVVHSPPKYSNSVQTNLKSKRAEMERYVPKPVAKELAQQGSVQQPATLSSPRKSTLEETTEREDLGSQSAIPASGNVWPAVESKGGDNKQNKQVKSHGAWRQRGPNELYHGQGLQQGSSSTPNSSKNYQKSQGQHEASNPVPTATNIIHEWDPSDGWHMPEYPSTEVSTVTSVVKDQGGVTGKGKRQAYKGQRSSVNNHDVYHKNVNSAEVDKNFMQSASLEINQTSRPVSSKEHRSSQWQPKSQSHRGDMSSGGQNASLEVKKDSPPQVQPEESVAEYKNAQEAPHTEKQEGRRGRSASFKVRPHSPNQGFGNLEDDAPSEQLHFHSGFRKNGGQNYRSSGQDTRQRQSLHYKYQPVGSNNNNDGDTSKFNNFDAPTEGSHGTTPRYRERGSGQPRRGGGNFRGRQSGYDL